MRNCVLVVERDPSVSRFMQLKLEEEGFSCLVDNIGDSVVDLAGQRQVDIIVLDPDDPMEDGDKILENVREISTIPIIYLSSDGSVDRKVEVLNAGADDYNPDIDGFCTSAITYFPFVIVYIIPS